MSNEVKHTQGPWTRVPQNGGGDLIAQRYETGNQMNPTGLRLIAFMMARGNSLNEDEANASLIAAAPDMLAALESIRDMPVMNAVEVYEIARAAISKAEGR